MSLSAGVTMLFAPIDLIFDAVSIDGMFSSFHRC
jgi:hypothetical protein